MKAKILPQGLNLRQQPTIESKVVTILKKSWVLDVIGPDVKVKMSICPECGNAIRVAVEHTMDTKSKNEFAKEVMKHDLQVKTISLDEYRSSNIQMYCKGNCSRKKL